MTWFDRCEFVCRRTGDRIRQRPINLRQTINISQSIIHTYAWMDGSAYQSQRVCLHADLRCVRVAVAVASAPAGRPVVLLLRNYVIRTGRGKAPCACIAVSRAVPRRSPCSSPRRRRRVHGRQRSARRTARATDHVGSRTLQACWAMVGSASPRGRRTHVRACTMPCVLTCAQVKV